MVEEMSEITSDQIDDRPGTGHRDRGSVSEIYNNYRHSRRIANFVCDP
jgi:hypothetical protein